MTDEISVVFRETTFPVQPWVASRVRLGRRGRSSRTAEQHSLSVMLDLLGPEQVARREVSKCPRSRAMVRLRSSKLSLRSETLSGRGNRAELRECPRSHGTSPFQRPQRPSGGGARGRPGRGTTRQSHSCQTKSQMTSIWRQADRLTEQHSSRSLSSAHPLEYFSLRGRQRGATQSRGQGSSSSTARTTWGFQNEGQPGSSGGRRTSAGPAKSTPPVWKRDWPEWCTSRSPLNTKGHSCLPSTVSCRCAL